MMMTSGDIWLAFLKTAGTLLLVIAVLVIFLRVIRRFSSSGSSQGKTGHIRVLSVHHFSPKEKVVLLDVMDRRILIGVTPSRISAISTFEGPWDEEAVPDTSAAGFRDIFSKALVRPFHRRAGEAMEDDER